MWAGFPKANQNEIWHRYSICTRCEHFDDKESVCNMCGCNITHKKQFLNKLAWADQECPDKKWSKIYRSQK